MTKGRAFEATARIFVAGFGCGILAGALVTGAAIWSSRDPVAAPAAVPHESARAAKPNDDALAAVRDEAPVGTAGAPGAAVPAPGPALRAAIPADLAERDLAIPVAGIEADQLVRSFDQARGGNRQHEAIDILAPRNTPVLAVEDGRIARLFTSKAGGITIYQFDPSQQFCYYYAHLERYADGLREGQDVRKGAVIGYVGVSGNAPKDTPHLHFAVFRLTPDKRWWEGTPLDPYDILR
jgi:murein DD-endopeptidase MepM/ murein hydrolase activator NlpD